MKFDKQALFYSFLGAASVIGLFGLAGCASDYHTTSYGHPYSSYHPAPIVIHHSPALVIHHGIHVPVYHAPIYHAPRYRVTTIRRTYVSRPSYRSSFGGFRSSRRR